MENKQLERQLKAIVQNLKGEEINRITETLQKDHNILLRKNFTSTACITQNRASIALAAPSHMINLPRLASDGTSKRP